MKQKKRIDPKITKANKSITKVSVACRHASDECRRNGSPVRSITFRVLDNGETRFHVTYRRKQ